MAYRKYQDLNPNNSKIFIDYTKEPEERVKFEVIGKRSKMSIVMKFFLKWWISCCIYPIFIISLFIMRTNQELGQTIMINGLINSLALTILVAFILSRTTWFIKHMPELNTIGEKFFKKEFTTKDLKEDLVENKIYCEIPLFKNVALDYRAYGEFSKYLTNFKIVNLEEFNLIKDGKKKIQEYLWKATWEFSETPKDGGIEVKFV